jgi:hypothetical protein
MSGTALPQVAGENRWNSWTFPGDPIRALTVPDKLTHGPGEHGAARVNDDGLVCQLAHT